MQSLIQEVENKFKKDALPDVRSGDTVRVHQEIHEGGKTRVQVFEGTVIRTRRKNSLSYSITVRRLSAGIGVEKTFLLHAPNIQKVEVTKRSKVRRKHLSYLRKRQGKSARLTEVAFDQQAVNDMTPKEEPKEDKKEKKQEKPENTEKENEAPSEKETEKGDESSDENTEDSDKKSAKDTK